MLPTELDQIGRDVDRAQHTWSLCMTEAKRRLAEQFPEEDIAVADCVSTANAMLNSISAEIASERFTSAGNAIAAAVENMESR